jgi:methylenetetrahydrofolate dehydrogenase (NADP+)/methenyltetrahydrofolate cyclohydrolase
MKFLNGKELAGYIKVRQGHEVRALRQAHGIIPKLAIIVTDDNPVIALYVRLKQAYGEDIDAEVEIHRVEQKSLKTLLPKLNEDTTVHGIIIQLPLADPAETDEVVKLIVPAKDVDGLGPKAELDPATPLAILWLLAGYNVALETKNVLLIGRGKLVGAPLEKMLLESGVDVRVADKDTKDVKAESIEADVIISATGHPGVLTSDMIKHGATVVDAGVASEGGKTVGDVAPEVYDREDLTITPQKGGVGPLTVCALFENVIRSAQRVSEKKA